MKQILKTLFAALVLVATTSIQITAQCSHEINDANGSYTVWAQSVLMDGNCATGNEFTSFEIERYHSNDSNGSRSGTIEIYSGESTEAGDLLYSQSYTLPALSTNSFPDTEWQAVTFSGGTGSLAFTPGNLYTFRMLGDYTRFKTGYGNTYTAGRFFDNTYNDLDMNFRVNSGVGSNTGGGSPVACENTAASVYQDDVFGPEQYGQSIVADAACLGGPDFTSVSVFHTGNGTPNVNIEIFQGEDVTGAPIYSEEGFVTAPGNVSGIVSEFVFGTGTNATGSLTYVDGETYTFLMTVTGSNHFIHASDDVIAGKFYYSDGVNPGAFQADKDLISGISAGDNSVTAVPTMGEWALITFGLIVMSMAVVTIRRRELIIITSKA